MNHFFGNEAPRSKLPGIKAKANKMGHCLLLVNNVIGSFRVQKS
jgi:hypothetical protein